MEAFAQQEKGQVQQKEQGETTMLKWDELKTMETKFWKQILRPAHTP